MSAQQPRITLRPPPHRDYLSGYPGIPACDPSTLSSPPTLDPLFPLPFVLRPQATLTGTVEIRSPLKGPAVRAKFLSVELEKIETVPPAPPSAGDGGAGGKKDAKASGGGEKPDGRFVELIGSGPTKLWEAGSGAADGVERTKSPVKETPKKKSGFKGLAKGVLRRPEFEDDEEDDGFEVIPDGNYPFAVPLPEGLPPTIEVDNKMNGVAYQIVATLICKGKKGLLKGAGKSTMVVASAPILLDKADLLRWPRYQPILPSPLPPKLPWAAPPGELTVGETKEAKLSIDRGDGRSGEVWMKATRASAAFGPGDAVELFMQVGWGGDQPIKLTRLDAVLRETIRFTYPSPNNPNYIIRGPPKVNTLFTATASVSADPNDQAAFAVLYQGEPVAFELSGMVPSDHARVTTRTAKHVDVSYHLKIRAMIEGGDEIAVDGWSVLLGTVSSRVGKGIMSEIGWVEGLCDRPGLPDPSVPSTTRSPVLAVPSSRAANKVESVPSFQSTPSPQRQQPSPAPPPAAFEPRFANSSTEKSRMLNSSQTSSRFGSSHQASSGGYHVANPSTPTTPDDKPSTPLPAPAPVRPAFVPSPTAEEEKRAAYDRATHSREQLQSSLRASQEAAPSPTDSFRSPTAEDDGAALHQAAILRRSVIHNGYSTQPELSPPLQDGFNNDTPLVARGHLSTGPARSNTLMAFSGSEVSAVPPPASPPPPQRQPQSPPRSPPVSSPGGSSAATAFLGRSLTTAETEKRRLFLDAKETARRRQEEARLELERQNRALAELEFEEAQNAYEDRLVAEAEYDKREAEHARLLAFEAEQKARIAADEERWAREEEERRARALAELDERKRRAEQAMQDELRRFEEQQRAAEREREDEIARQMAERKAEEEMKRAKAEELKRQDEEREREEQARRSATLRKQEMERERAEMERRRREGEEARARAAAQAAAEAEARARWEEEERHLREEAERAEAAAAEAVRRREEHQRELARQRRAEEDAKERQVVEKEARQRRAAEEAKALAAQQVAQQQPAYPATEFSYDQPAYPILATQPSDYPQQAAANIHRAPSVASFAPSTSAAAADASFYVQALAQHSSQSEAKAAYLRQLRQHEEQRRAAVPLPLASRAPSVRRPSQPQPITPYQSDPSAAMNPYGGYPQPSFHPQPPLPPQPPYAGGLSRSNTYIPPTPSSSTAPAYPIESTSQPPLEHNSTAPTDPVPPPVPPLPASVNAAPATSSSSSSTGYKTAAEEKEEAAARRRAEDACGKQPAPVQEEDEEDALPSYPVADTSATAPSAAEEKAEMERYYAAKAAVDARQAPPPPPARANTAGFDHYGNTPAPGYHAPSAPSYPSPSAPYSGAPAYPSQLSASAGAHPSAPSDPARTPQLSESQSSGSHEPYRDPAIAAGKRTARPSTGGSSAAGPAESSYAYAPSAPPLPASSSPSPGGYYASPPPPLPPAASSQYGGGNGDITRADAHQALVDVNHAGFGSFSVDAFPEFEELAGQIAAAARGGSAEQQQQQ